MADTPIRWHPIPNSLTESYSMGLDDIHFLVPNSLKQVFMGINSQCLDDFTQAFDLLASTYAIVVTHINLFRIWIENKVTSEYFWKVGFLIAQVNK